MTINLPQWSRFEAVFSSAATYANPLQEVTLRVTFTAPSGRTAAVDGFWDGDATWRVRFLPDEGGTWSYRTHCSDPANSALHDQSGGFTCGEPGGATRFRRHGPLRLSADRHHLAHADGTPFFLLADTAWNVPVLAKPPEWRHYLRDRARQKFTAVQFMATNTFVAPDGDWTGAEAYSGHARIAVNPRFFGRLDERIDALNAAGLLAIPVMLWAANWNPEARNDLNPGYSLPEDQAVLLARYMLARWNACDVAWILPGDGDYRGEKAERWRRLGRAIFGDSPHAPTMLHPAGMHWNLPDLRDESWLDVIAYQSGHGDDDPTLAWIVEGPPAADWAQEPVRPFINLEPPYEDHVAYQSGRRFDAHAVRRAIYWSLLVAPPAGVTYGGHGVWGWDDGTAPPIAHPKTGVPQHWLQALLLPGAEQMAHLRDLFESIDWWALRPAPELLASQPGVESVRRFVAAARTHDAGLALVYTPEPGVIDVRSEGLPSPYTAQWFDPASGRRSPAAGAANGETVAFSTPGPGDWVLLLAGLDDRQLLAQARELIRNEGEVVAEIADGLGASFTAAARLVAECPGVVMVTGAGTSGTIARRMAHLFATCGLHAFYVSAAEALHGPSASVAEGDVLIALSKAGRSAEINNFARITRERGGRVISLTWEPASELAEVSDIVLVVRPDVRGEGEGVLPFGSTLANGAVGDALVLAAKRLRGFNLATLVQTHPAGGTADLVRKN